MNLFKKSVLRLSLIACLLVTAHAMALTCPPASAFTNLEQYQIDGADVWVWEKFLPDGNGGEVDYMVRPAAGKTYQYTMQQAYPQLVACPSGKHGGFLMCVYRGPHLHHVVSCADGDHEDWLPPEGMAAVLFDDGE